MLVESSGASGGHIPPVRQTLSNGVPLIPLREHWNAQLLRVASEDTPKVSKGGSTALLTRALSFKGRLGSKIGGMKSPLRPADKIVKVEPSGGSDTLESKVEHVWRALNFYRSVVEKRITEKSINDMLPGSATVVLEMVAALNLALRPSFSNQNSSAVAEAVAGVNHSLAELVRWSDQLLLHDDHHHNTRTADEVVSAVRDAVQALVDLAADKKNIILSDSGSFPSSHENNNSLEKSPTYYSKRHSDVSSHRNSLPEIKADSPTDRGSRNLLSVTDGLKLSHSVSSDSILTGPDLETPPPKPPLPHGRSDGAPPLPPKMKNLSVNSAGNIISSPAYLSSSLSYSSPLNHSSTYNYSTVVQDSPHIHGTPLSHSLPHNHSSPHSHSSTYGHSARESSSDQEQVSPASSLDSMTQEPPALRFSLNSTGSLHCDRNELDFESALQRNFRISSDSGYPSLTSVSSLSSTNTAINSVSQYSSKTCTQTFISSQVGGSRVTHHSQRTVTYSSSTQHTSTTTRSSTSSSSSASSSEGEKAENHVLSLTVPPKLPVKVRGRGSIEARGSEDGRSSDDGRTSTYDNLEVDHMDGSVARLKMHHKGDPSPRLPPKAGCSMQSVSSSSSSTSSSSGSLSSSYSSTNVVLRRQHKMETTIISGSDDSPPPLPMKKKYVQNYMRWFGEAPVPNPNELLRHSVHQMHMESHYTDTETDLLHTSHLTSIISGIDSYPPQPPALPPKTRRTGINEGPLVTRQSLPTPSLPSVPVTQRTASQPTSLRLSDSHTEEKAEPEEVIIEDQTLEIERKQESVKEEQEEKAQDEKEVEEEEEEDSVLDMLDVKEFLILKKEGEEGPDIRGGPVDALIVHASKLNKNDFLYQEAFLTTYRTFVTPDALVKKLLHRYKRFVSSPRQEYKTAAHNAFSLLVRVVDDLAMIDLTIETLETLTDFEYSLLCGGELWLARVLRKKIVEKLEARNRNQDMRESQRMMTISSQGVTTKQFNLLSFKSHMVAEQMTLLDAELFLTMEIPEVLLWASEQNEERSPNLTTFTEHFNKMSYWARSRILEQGDSKDRERYVMKFIKIMKHLRKMNNFNSYLALLSALDSAPIRRLEWQKTITDGLKEYCALIDSSSSFRAYRQALSDSTPPCIPYIGLILQDLTFVNIGNSDNLPDSSVNFSKRWQQFNILDNMKRFKKCQYPFKRNEDIIGFLDNFNSYMSEESLWDISENIKPRRKKN